MKKVVILLAFVLIVTNAKAQVFSTMQIVSESPDQPLIVVSADLNNDGYDDVAYSSIGDDEVSCNLFNPASGTFDNTILLGTEFSYCTSLFAADLDNDGLIDILAVSQTSSKVGWYKNTGNGNFSIQPYINDNALYAAGISAADVDLDGDMDVVSAQKGDNTVLLYLNNGDGSFQEPLVITAAAQIPVVVVCGDINNDNYPDIISGYGQSDKIVYFMNNGDGTFQPEVTVTDQADLINTIITADLNNDGNLDIVSASKNDNKIAWYQNLDGNGSFSSQIIISQSVTNALGLASADFDLDGDPDLTVTSPNDDKVYLFKNNDLDFQRTVVCEEILEPKGVAAGDFNNDGLIDMAVADAWSAEYNNKIYWFINGKSSFVVHNINHSISSWHLAMNDYNKDGNIDIFYSDGHTVAMVKNEGSGVFGNEQVLYAAGYNIYDLGFADANNDSYDDLFVADAMGDMLFWFINQNGTGFSSPIFIDTQSDAPVSLDFADVDGDGNVDVLVALANGNEIALYLNTQGGGNFTKSIVTDTVIGPMCICFSDFNNDGSEDIFYSDNDRVGYLVNDGSGNFSGGGIASSSGTYATKLVNADINNDGYNDIVCNPGYANWLENNHDGTYTSHEIETWGGSYYVASGDLDNNGEADIVSAAGNVNRAYFLKNINEGENFDISIYAVDQEIRAVAVGDINNDGYDDITLGSWPAEQLSWAENYVFRIIHQPENTASCEGGEALFSVLTAGVVGFQWQQNDGQSWSDIENNSSFGGVNKALLKVSNVSGDMFGNQFRCVLTDDQNNQHFTQEATLSEYQATVACVEDQQRTADNTNTYTVVGSEFDPDTVSNPCNGTYTLVNDYNDQETLNGEVLQVGDYTIVWMLMNQQDKIIDTCSFELVIETVTDISEQSSGSVSIFPNPFTGYIMICSSGNNGSLQIDITDVNGRLILHQKMHADCQKFDLSEYETGIYLVKVTSNHAVFVEKIVKR